MTLLSCMSVLLRLLIFWNWWGIDCLDTCIFLLQNEMQTTFCESLTNTTDVGYAMKTLKFFSQQVILIFCYTLTNHKNRTFKNTHTSSPFPECLGTDDSCLYNANCIMQFFSPKIRKKKKPSRSLFHLANRAAVQSFCIFFYFSNVQQQSLKYCANCLIAS